MKTNGYVEQYTKLAFRSGLFCILLMLSYSFASEAQRHQPNRSLDMILDIGKQNVNVGESLYATVRILNNGSLPANVRRNLFPQAGRVQIQITTDQGRKFLFKPLSVTFDVSPLSKLDPGTEIGATFPIFYGGVGWTIVNKPGEYIIQAMYKFRSETEEFTLRSNSITVTVLPADSAGKFLTEGQEALQAGKFLLWQGGDHLDQGIEHLKALIAKYPESVLADYAGAALGTSLSREFKDFTKDQLRLPKYKEALGYFEKIRTENLPPYLKILKTLAHARCFLSLGQNEQGAQLLGQARELTRDLPKWHPVLTLLKELESKLSYTP